MVSEVDEEKITALSESFTDIYDLNADRLQMRRSSMVYSSSLSLSLISNRR